MSHDLKDSGQRETYPSGMVRETRTHKGRYDLVSPYALKRLALVYERGARKYSERNWELGAPFCRFLDSAMRHIQQYLMRQTDEDHLAHAAWNLFAVMHFEEIGRLDLDDRPNYEPKPEAKVEAAPEHEVEAILAHVERGTTTAEDAAKLRKMFGDIGER